MFATTCSINSTIKNKTIYNSIIMSDLNSNVIMEEPSKDVIMPKSTKKYFTKLNIIIALVIALFITLAIILPIILSPKIPKYDVLLTFVGTTGEEKFTVSDKQNGNNPIEEHQEY